MMWLKELYFKNVRGSVAIEMALITPFLALLLSGIINFGLILANQNQLYGVVNAGMLYAAGAGATMTPAKVQTVMQGASSMTPLTITTSSFCQCAGAGAACTSTCSDGSVPRTYITMTAQSSVTLIAPDFIINNPFTTSATGTVRTN